ncbi:methyltransferase [Acetobacter sp. LMG 1636]|uniref:Methyltransferase n=2 Tax=Acetobacter fallax TaxID=1737473 RepID=A0ABX0K8Y4_9PROT|nr:methyltransferase [Acetobacter fallax]NHO34830.1 methyltransferase [Acetobacter fallax]
MAALVPARRGERVIEAGCGAGAGLLCLTRRVSGLEGLGVELDGATVRLAEENFRDNHHDNLTLLNADITDPSFRHRVAGAAACYDCRHGPLPADRRFDHAFANPPWHRVNTTPSPEMRRDKARRATRPDTILAWISALASLLRPKGSLTLALPADLTAPALAACEASDIGSAEIVPLWPEPGREARIILIRGRLHGRAGSRLLPGLVLHHSGGGFTREAEAVLRDGHALFPESFRATHRRTRSLTLF